MSNPKSNLRNLNDEYIEDLDICNGYNKKKHKRKSLNSEKLCNFLCIAHHEYYSELVSTMSSHIALKHIDLQLVDESGLNNISEPINKIVEQKRVKREPFDKKFYLVKQYAAMKNLHFVCYQKNHFLT